GLPVRVRAGRRPDDRGPAARRRGRQGPGPGTDVAGRPRRSPGGPRTGHRGARVRLLRAREHRPGAPRGGPLREAAAGGQARAVPERPVRPARLDVPARRRRGPRRRRDRRARPGAGLARPDRAGRLPDGGRRAAVRDRRCAAAPAVRGAARRLHRARAGLADDAGAAGDQVPVRRAVRPGLVGVPVHVRTGPDAAGRRPQGRRRLPQGVPGAGDRGDGRPRRRVTKLSATVPRTSEALMRISFTALTGGGPRDVVMDVDSDATVGGVAQSLAALLDVRAPQTAPPPGASLQAPGARQRRPLWMDGRMLDPQALAVKELRDGAVVAVERNGAAATVLSEPAGLVEVRVVGGPAAGPVHRLGLGVSTVGSGRDVDVVLDDPSVPARSLRLTVGRGTVQVEASARTIEGGAALDGAELTGRTEWPPGALLTVGASVLALTPSTAPDAHLEPLPEGGLAFDPPPRQIPPRRERRLEVPEPPDRSPRELIRMVGRRSPRTSLKEYRRR